MGWAPWADLGKGCMGSTGARLTKATVSEATITEASIAKTTVIGWTIAWLHRTIEQWAEPEDN